MSVIEEPTELRVPGRLNAATVFVDANIEAGRGDDVAIRYVADDSVLTYSDVLDTVNRTGSALLELGLDPGQRLALLLLDTPDFPAVFFGAIKAGVVPVPLTTLLKASEYLYLLEDSRARGAVVSASLLPSVLPVLDQLHHLRHLIVAPDPYAPDTDLPPAPPGIAVHRLADLQAAAAAELAPAATGADDVCFWLYSSGTTGFPKGTVHLQHDMLVCAQTYARHVLQIASTDCTYSVAKLFFAYGLGNALYFPFSVGASTVLYPGRPEPEVVFDILSRYRPTIFYSVPTSYGALLAYPEAPPAEALASLRLCISAGEALPAALLSRWQERYGLELLDGIGSTEVLQMFISNRPGEVVAGSTGRIVPGYGARIVDEDGADVPVGEVGDLLVRGDSICASYWNKPEQTRATIEGEWIRTGDKYRVDEQGYFWYQGRSDDMLKVGGIWVSPFEVEAAVLEHEAVQEVAVVGCEDDDGLVKPKAFVVLRPAAEAPDEAELKRFVKEQIALYKYPRWIEFVDELPKTATGKIQRYRLR
jgi:benzoate-CoA ligase